MSGRSGRGRGGRGRGGRGVLSHTSPGNVSSTSSSHGIGTSPSLFSGSMPSSSAGTSGTQNQYQFVPRMGTNTGFPQEGPSQQPWHDPAFGEQGVDNEDDMWANFEDLIGAPCDSAAAGEQEEAEPRVSFKTLLETPGRAERLHVLNPDFDAPPHTRWPGRDSGSGISRKITQLIHKAFDKPYYSWKYFPEEKKKKLLYDFAQWYHWDYDLHHTQVADMVNEVGAKRIRDVVYKVKKGQSQPPWILDHVWQAMTQFWATEVAKKRSDCYSANRRSDRDGLGMAKHVGGSKSFDQYETDMSIELGRPVGISEVFRKTHTKNGEFVDQVAKKVVEVYEQTKELRLSQVDPDLTSDGRTEVPALTQHEDDEIFIQAAASLRPGHPAYGIPKRRALSADGSSSSRPSGWTAMADEVAAMKEKNAELEEKLREIDAKRQQEMEMMNAMVEEERVKRQQDEQAMRERNAKLEAEMEQFRSILASLRPPNSSQ